MSLNRDFITSKVPPPPFLLASILFSSTILTWELLYFQFWSAHRRPNQYRCWNKGEPHVTAVDYEKTANPNARFVQPFSIGEQFDSTHQPSQAKRFFGFGIGRFHLHVSPPVLRIPLKLYIPEWSWFTVGKFVPRPFPFILTYSQCWKILLH